MDQSPAFHAESFAYLYTVEQNHFWFRIRNQILIHLTNTYLAPYTKPLFLELGCGTGFVLDGLTQNKNFQMIGSELFWQGLHFARQRLPQQPLVQLDARQMPFKETFQAVGAFDVLEHIPEDQQVISHVWDILQPGGYFFVTVPQHPWLWSLSDELACHQRRYTRAEMIHKLTAAGFKIAYCSSFISTLLPLLILNRLLFRPKFADQHGRGNQEMALPAWQNNLLERLSHLDYWAIRHGFSLPWGGSLVVVATKDSS
ncbi:MAG: class I SAM-dependent methyltransferase [Magnetococcales bacterium]|nr:class I SAM-dependent methyltransferase [Magnetococcales bacterium]